jgi:hypothetical protein
MPALISATAHGMCQVAQSPGARGTRLSYALSIVPAAPSCPSNMRGCIGTHAPHICSAPPLTRSHVPARPQPGQASALHCTLHARSYRLMDDAGAQPLQGPGPGTALRIAARICRPRTPAAPHGSGSPPPYHQPARWSSLTECPLNARLETGVDPSFFLSITSPRQPAPCACGTSARRPAAATQPCAAPCARSAATRAARPRARPAWRPAAGA